MKGFDNLDAKMCYSKSVEEQKEVAEDNKRLEVQIENGKKRSTGNSSNILSEDKKDDANIIQFLNENISKEEFLSNGIDGGEITFDNN